MAYHAIKSGEAHLHSAGSSASAGSARAAAKVRRPPRTRLRRSRGTGPLARAAGGADALDDPPTTARSGHIHPMGQDCGECRQQRASAERSRTRVASRSNLGRRRSRTGLARHHAGNLAGRHEGSRRRRAAGGNRAVEKMARCRRVPDGRPWTAATAASSMTARRPVCHERPPGL